MAEFSGSITLIDASNISTSEKQHFWFNPTATQDFSAGAYITSTKAEDYQDPTKTSSYKKGSYLLATSNGLEIGQDTTVAASVSSTGLRVQKGGVKGGTAGQSGFVYLSTDPYGSYTINGSTQSDWKEIIGTKFGVRNDGTLYASGANISGVVNITGSGSNVYTQNETDTKINNIEVGGRNLLRGTADYSGWGVNSNYTVSNGVATVSNSGSTSNVNRVLQMWVGSGVLADFDGKDVVISMDLMSPNWSELVETDSFTGLNALAVQFITTSGTPYGSYTGIARGRYAFSRLGNGSSKKWWDLDGVTLTNNKWIRLTSKPIRISADTTFFSSYDSDTNIYDNLLFYFMLRRNGTISIRNIKIELGTKATDWSPAPEDAMKQEQRIYYRTDSTTITPTAPTTWITSTTTANATWTTKRMEYDRTYKYLYTCIQRQTEGGGVTNTAVLLDDTTTVIDGGNIITGTVTANQLNASNINASNTFTVGAFTTSTQDEVLNSNIKIGGQNLLGNTSNPFVPNGSNAVATMTFRSIGRYNSPDSEFSLEAYDTSSNSMVITSSVTGNRGVSWYTKAGEIIAGETYTFSCKVKASVSCSVHTHTAWRNGSATAGYVGWTKEGDETISANIWTDYSYTFTPSSNAQLSWEFLVALCFTGQTDGVTCRIAHAQLERGNKATDWSPVIEDVEVGGENLLQQFLPINNPTSYNCYRIPLTENLIAGQTYTLQLWGVTFDNTPAGGTVEAYWGGGNNRLTGALTPDANGYVVKTFTVTQAFANRVPDGGKWFLSIYNSTPSSAKTARNMTLERWKLEKGNKATSWSLSSADTKGGINLLRCTADMNTGSGGWPTGNFRYSGNTGGVISHVTAANPHPDRINGAIRVTNSADSALRLGFCQDSVPDLKTNKLYTLSGWVRASVAGLTIDFQPIYVTSSAQSTGAKSVGLTDTSWSYYSVTLRLKGDQATTYSAGYIYVNNVPSNGWFEVMGLKLEEGAIATGWHKGQEADASNFVTQIDNSGIFISPTDQSPTTNAAGNSVRIDGNGMKVYKGGILLADYGPSIALASSGATVTIGKTDNYHTVLTSSGMYFKNGANSTSQNLLTITGNAINIYKSNTATATVTINSSGKLTASDVDLTGKITTSSGTIGGITIGATYLTTKSDRTTYDATAAGLTMTTSGIGAGNGSTNTFKVVASTGALTATIATITGTVTANTFTAKAGASGNTRIRVDSTNGLIIYDSNGSKALDATANGLAFYKAGLKRAAVTADGLDIFGGDGTTSIASFGETVRVGKENDNAFYVRNNGFSLYSAVAGKNAIHSSTADIKLTTMKTIALYYLWIPSGQTKTFPLEALSSYSTDTPITVTLLVEGEYQKLRHYNEKVFNFTKSTSSIAQSVSTNMAFLTNSGTKVNKSVTVKYTGSTNTFVVVAPTYDSVNDFIIDSIQVKTTTYMPSTEINGKCYLELDEFNKDDFLLFYLINNSLGWDDVFDTIPDDD